MRKNSKEKQDLTGQQQLLELIHRARREVEKEAEMKTLKDTLLILEELIWKIHELLSERPKLGYLDADEFVRDAIRRRIQQLKKTTGKSKSDYKARHLSTLRELKE